MKAGAIGEIGLSWPLHPDEEKVLRAAVDAQKQTGVAMLIHPGFHPSAPRAAMEIVLAGGGRPDRTIMSHVDLRLFNLEAVALAVTGCYLEFDLFGHEVSLHPWGPVDVPNDVDRVDYLMALIEREVPLPPADLPGHVHEGAPAKVRR